MPCSGKLGWLFPMRHVVTLIVFCVTLGSLGGALSADDSKPVKPDPRLLARLEGSSGRCVSFNSDGTLILTAGGKEARVWSARDYRPVTEPLIHAKEVQAAVFSDDGKRVLTATIDEARVWEAASGKAAGPAFHDDDFITAAALSPDGKWIAIVANESKTVRLCDVATGALVHGLEHKGLAWLVLFSPDGQTLLTVDEVKAGDSFDDRVHLWDVHAGTERGQVLTGLLAGGTRPAAFSTDGSRIVTGGVDHYAIWDAKSGGRLGDNRGKMEGSHGVQSVAFSPDGRKVVISDAGTVSVWDAVAGVCLSPSFGVGCNGEAVFTPDGKKILAAAEAQGGLFDAATGKRVQYTRDNGWRGPSLSVIPQSGCMLSWGMAAVSPDGLRIVVGHTPRDQRTYTAILKVEPDAVEPEP